MSNVISELGKDRLNDIYLIFRKQFYTLTDGGFAKWWSSLSSTQEDIIEVVVHRIDKLHTILRQHKLRYSNTREPRHQYSQRNHSIRY